jgi:hypothetical protein
MEQSMSRDKQVDREMELEDLRQAITLGLEQLNRGEGISGEQVFRELHEMSEQHRAANRARENHS